MVWSGEPYNDIYVNELVDSPRRVAAFFRAKAKELQATEQNGSNANEGGPNE